MTTQNLKDGPSGIDAKQSETLFASPSCDGSEKELKSYPEIGHYYREMDPSHMGMAIALAYDELARADEKPGSDYFIVSTRSGRARLYDTVRRYWMEVANETDPERFFCLEDTVMVKFAGFRRFSPGQKSCYIAIAKQHIE